MEKFRIDLHVHTRRYSQCAESLDPEKLVQAATAVGLDGLVITDHDVMWGEEETQLLMQRTECKIKIYRGVEISSVDGHFIVIGLQDMSGIQTGISAKELFAKSRRSGAVVIFAHPQRSGRSTELFHDHEKWHHCVDAVEVASTYTFDQHETVARKLAIDAGLADVAGSDAHCLSRVGLAYTEFNFLPADERALARAIRENAGTPKRSR